MTCPSAATPRVSTARRPAKAASGGCVGLRVSSNWNGVAKVGKPTKRGSKKRNDKTWKWHQLDPNNLPRGPVLVTNNPSARNGHGNMSHVWVGYPIKAENPERDGDVIIYTDDWRKVYSLTHYARIVPPELT